MSQVMEHKACQSLDVEDGRVRNILCVFPRYVPSFGTFEYAYPLTGGVRAFMPPQGLLVIAAVLPKSWNVRFIDENMRRASADDFAWADAVFVSGMHIQRRRMEEICERAHAFGKVAVLGGPSVSACPELYPAFDYLHIGELGDATDALIGMLSRDVSRPREQIMLKTKVRRDLRDFPAPAYELAEIDRYFLGSVQFSSGCPYTCEFCDIPGLYGRVPRLKTPAQLIDELDKLLACGVNGSIYFVDDNFIANRRALRDLLPHLVQWQKRNGYAVSLSCEATLNIARSPEILGLMREAAFDTIFCGIETPEPEALSRDRQAAQYGHADPRCGSRHQPAWDGGRLRNHSRPRHRHAGNRARAFSNFWSNPKSRWRRSICCRPCRARRFGTACNGKPAA